MCSVSGVRFFSVSEEYFIVNCGKLKPGHAAVTPLDVAQESWRRQTHPHKQCGEFDSWLCYKKRNNLDISNKNVI